jgi:vitamin B12 transporter
LRLEKMSSSVVVSDTAQPTTLQTAPDLVNVITKEQIDQRQAIWMVDMLASEEGVSFDRGGPFGGVTGLFLDGGNSNYTKVLVDGTPVNQPGGAIDFSNFMLLNVDKIEIVHGASSALYGSDAMDGVVQIFTHRGATTVPQLTLEGDGGTFGTGNGGAQLSGLLARSTIRPPPGIFQPRGKVPATTFAMRLLRAISGGNSRTRIRCDLRCAIALAMRASRDKRCSRAKQFWASTMTCTISPPI